MKVKINGLKFLIALFLLIDVYFFSLKIIGYTIYSINSNQQEILGVLCIFLMLVLIRPFRKKRALFSSNIIFFYLWYFIVFVYSVLKYGQGIGNVFIASNYCFILLFYYIVRYYFTYYDIVSFNEAIVTISCINMILHILQWILSSSYIFLFFNDSNMRMGVLRLGHATSAITMLGVLIALCTILSPQTKKTFKHYLTVALGIVCLLLVSRGRVTILAMFITGTYALCYRDRNNAVKIIGGAFTVIVFAYLFLKFTPLGNSYLASLSLEDTGSFRLIEMKYFWNHLMKNPIFGMGFIRQMGFGDVPTHLVTGPNYHYSRTDIGIVGLASTFGIIGLIWYIIFLVKMGRCIWHKNRQNNYYPFLEMLVRALFIWNLAYIPTMILFRPYGISIFAIELAYIDYVCKTSENTNQAPYKRSRKMRPDVCINS